MFRVIMEEFIDIKIIAVPSGEAPINIRKKWLGLVFPAVKFIVSINKNFYCIGVITGNRNIPCYDGYLVDRNVAIKILEKKNRKVAKWWRNSTIVSSERSRFLFGKNECEILKKSKTG